MQNFPATPDYSGLNAPIAEEYELKALPVEGRIPTEIAGSFFRATPDPAFAPYMEDSAASLSGDGMVSVVRIGGGTASFAIRYVQTARHQAEVAAGRALFGKYRNRFTDLPEVQRGPHRRQHHAGVARRQAVDGEGRRAPVSHRIHTRSRLGPL